MCKLAVLNVKRKLFAYQRGRIYPRFEKEAWSKSEMVFASIWKFCWNIS